MEAFELVSKAYDHWYEEPEGRAIFAAELEALRSLVGTLQGEWLEVGVGTGRFAQSLGIRRGIDPSRGMLKIAATRGIQTIRGNAEDIPFPRESFDGVLLALTLCFVTDAKQALGECARVLRPSGKLLIGAVPLDSPWGTEYVRQANQGHTIYALARFRTTEEIKNLATQAGFSFRDARSTLLSEPGHPPNSTPRTQVGISSGAGFVGLLFEKKRAHSANQSDNGPPNISCHRD